jgi:translation initiation factor eIF-2B subunit alpha/methylthioribose-1-phosphate isomerase
MLVNGKNMHALWFEDNILKFIDQRKLPFKIEIFSAKTVDDVVYAINEMIVRGAPSIGVAAAYGMVLGEKDLKKSSKKLRSSRPTAHDLFYAIDYMIDNINNGEKPIYIANKYMNDIVNRCKKIGENGEKIIEDGMKILTHCNAGALATVDYGTALAPIRFAHRNGKKIFLFVDETRPRCQGQLTSWELKNEEIDHCLIVDNAAGYFMKNGDIDLVITGADRIAKNYDFANKIGTYEKAVVAKENGIPFYVAAPLSTFDKEIESGNEIIIEERDEKELYNINGKNIMPEWIKIKNPSFDVTPKKYITGVITEEGIKKIN